MSGWFAQWSRWLICNTLITIVNKQHLCLKVRQKVGDPILRSWLLIFLCLLANGPRALDFMSKLMVKT